MRACQKYPIGRSQVDALIGVIIRVRLLLNLLHEATFEIGPVVQVIELVGHRHTFLANSCSLGSVQTNRRELTPFPQVQASGCPFSIQIRIGLSLVWPSTMPSQTDGRHAIFCHANSVAFGRTRNLHRLAGTDRNFSFSLGFNRVVLPD